MSEDAAVNGPTPEEIADENRRDEPVPSTHLRWAEAMVRDQVAGDLLHVTASGWHFWNGAYWERDAEDKHTLREIANYVSGYRNAPYELENEGARRAAFSAVAKAEQAGYLTGIAAVMSRIVSCGIDELDPGHWLLCTENGVLDLRPDFTRKDGEPELSAHRQVLKQTMSCRTEWRPGALSGSLFEKAVSEIFPDDAVRRYVQRMLGTTLAGLPLEQKALVFYGPKAGNGKSTLLEAVAATLGGYARAGEIALLTQADKHPEALADLHRRRVAFFSELPEDGVLAEAGFKRITGNDTVTVRHLYKDRFTFLPQFSVVIATNRLPRVRGDDEGTWRRLAIVPCVTVFEGERDDTALKYRLQREPKERAACLEWLVAGLWDYLSTPDSEYAVPEAVAECIRECRDDNDVVGQFLKDCTAPAPGGLASYGDLHGAFARWFSEVQGQTARMSQNQLTKTLKRRRGYEERKSGGVRGLGGITVKPEWMAVKWRP